MNAIKIECSRTKFCLRNWGILQAHQPRSLGSSLVVIMVICNMLCALSYGCGSSQKPSFQCRQIWERKSLVDSLFIPTKATGVVSRVFGKTYADHNNFRYVTVRANPTTFVGQPWNLRELEFSDPLNIRLGLRACMEGFVSVGDTFVKPPMSPIFYFISKRGDTLFTELQYNGYCDGKHCIYERSNDQLCYYGFGIGNE